MSADYRTLAVNSLMYDSDGSRHRKSWESGVALLANEFPVPATEAIILFFISI